MADITISRTEPVDEVLNAICGCLPVEYRDAVKDKIIETFLGSWVYFPKSLQRVKRNREIVERFFSGETRANICREYRISRQHLHSIIVAHHISARRSAPKM